MNVKKLKFIKSGFSIYDPRTLMSPATRSQRPWMRIEVKYKKTVKMNKIHSLNSMIYSLKASSHNHRMVFSICLCISFAK